MDTNLIGKLLQEHFCHLREGATVDAALECAHNPNQHAPEMIRVLQSNQAMMHFISRIELFRKRIEDDGDTTTPISEKITRGMEKIVGILGKRATRNLILGMRMQSVREPGYPKTFDEKFQIDPQALLKFALRAESFHEDRQMAYGDNAFLAGLQYDWILNQIPEKAPGKKELLAQVDTIWGIHFEAGLIAYELGSLIKNFKYAPYALAGTVASGVGKLLMLYAYTGGKSYNLFMAEMEKIPERRPWVQAKLEKRNFEWRSHELAAVYLRFHKHLGEIEKAVYYMHEPYMLKHIDNDLYRLAVIISSCLSLTSIKDRGLRAAKAPLAQMHRIALKEIGISEEQLKATLTRIQLKGI